MNPNGEKFLAEVNENDLGEEMPQVVVESVFSRDVTKISPQCTKHLLSRCFPAGGSKIIVPKSLQEMLLNQLKPFLKPKWTCRRDPPSSSSSSGLEGRANGGKEDFIPLSRPPGSQYSNFNTKNFPFSSSESLGPPPIYQADDRAINLIISQTETAGQLCWLVENFIMRTQRSTDISAIRFAEVFLEQIVDELVFGGADVDNYEQDVRRTPEHQMHRYYVEGRKMMYQQKWKDEWFVGNQQCNFAALTNALQRSVGMFTQIKETYYAYGIGVSVNRRYACLDDVDKWTDYARVANIFECAKPSCVAEGYYYHAPLSQLLFAADSDRGAKVTFDQMREVMRTDFKAKRGIFVLIAKVLCVECWKGPPQEPEAALLETFGLNLNFGFNKGSKPFAHHEFFRVLPQFLGLEWFHVLLEQVPIFALLWNRLLEIRGSRCQSKNWSYKNAFTSPQFALCTRAFACLRHSASISRTALHSIFVRGKRKPGERGGRGTLEKSEQKKRDKRGIISYDVFCLVMDFLLLGTEFGDARGFRKKLKFSEQC